MKLVNSFFVKLLLFYNPQDGGEPKNLVERLTNLLNYFQKRKVRDELTKKIEELSDDKTLDKSNVYILWLFAFVGNLVPDKESYVSGIETYKEFLKTDMEKGEETEASANTSFVKRSSRLPENK